MKIRKNDLVQVTAGNDRGKRGKVLKVFPDKMRIGVTGQAINGEVSALTLEQKILGCKQGAAACDAITTGAVGALNPGIKQSVNDKSTFAAVAVADSYTCADVKAQEAGLFN